MSNIRQTVRDLLVDKCQLSEEASKSLEVGIYNWAIEYATQQSIIKNWSCKGFTNVYMDKARSVIDNLDKNSYIKNIKLQDKLNGGEFTPKELPFLPNDVIFPERWDAAMDKKMRREESAFEDKIEANTTAFRCGKCGGRECRYVEKQVRSADESMSVFLTCLNKACMHRWRIG